MAMSAKPVFEMIASAVETQGTDMVKKAKAVFQFDLKGKGEWIVDLKNGSGSVKEGKAEKADVTITLAEDDFLAMAMGKLDGTQAFMAGKLKLKGNMMLAQKLTGIFESAGLKAP
eukprot:gnl/MRDRNA2_/MRDRNA2_127376_c0_seq1.p1 gnl/MRDRNA2_/MRDRNA2_127376_c0~~gnl/MRDRNA2_/MRDRNA2_127376_c0_seq1.p1  ORF type:complete len:115 (-),score=38.60 gnl/MRDRNA2_/MRDRNA2_127376_c0_seq1:305-649(-)